MPNSFAQFAAVLRSPAAQKIDFWINSIHIDGIGLSAVMLSIFTKIAGFTGISMRIEPQIRGAGASYNPKDNYISFPTDQNFGSTAIDRMTIVHETVHALQDIYASQWLSSRIKINDKFVDNEAAAYIAGALYSLNDTGLVYRGSPFDEAFIIAKSIVNRKGAVVSKVMAHSLTTAIATNPVYSNRGITMTTPDLSDGI